MKLPVEVLPNISSELVFRWKQQFEEPGRTQAEGLWRRTQDEKNKVHSRMQTENDKRRRIIHFVDEYEATEVDGRYSLSIVSLYLWIQLALPSVEIEEYVKLLKKALSQGRWTGLERNNSSSRYERESMMLELDVKMKDERDELASRTFPSDYLILEALLIAGNPNVSQKKESPWAVLNTGIREKDTRGNPTRITHLSDLERLGLLPFQVELGCGPSIEAGIPPLHYLHDVYKVVDPKTGCFIFDHEQDTLLREIAINPEKFYQQASLPYVASLKAEPTNFYRLLASMFERKIAVGEVITNNFDGLTKVVGVPERYVRRYEEVHITPQINFDSNARSLLVVGSHADRRRIQHAARAAGKTVIYVDPEGYHLQDGTFNPYPLESPQDGDYLIQMTAEQFSIEMSKSFGIPI